MTRFERGRSLGYLLNVAARQLSHALQQRIAVLGLAPAQMSVLLELAEADGLTQRDLVARLRVDQSTMAHTLRRMERDGLVTSSAHESDARSSRLHLTPKAAGLIDPATEAAACTNTEALTPLDPGEADQLIALLRRLVDTSP